MLKCLLTCSLDGTISRVWEAHALILVCLLIRNVGTTWMVQECTVWQRYFDYVYNISQAFSLVCHFLCIWCQNRLILNIAIDNESAINTFFSHPETNFSNNSDNTQMHCCFVSAVKEGLEDRRTRTTASNVHSFLNHNHWTRKTQFKLKKWWVSVLHENHSENVSNCSKVMRSFECLTSINLSAVV